MDATTEARANSKPSGNNLPGRSRRNASDTPWEAIVPADDRSLAQNRRAETHPVLSEAPIGTLFGQLFDEMNTLVHKEVDLARTELQSNVEDGMRMVKWFSVASLCAGSALTLLLMALVFALAEKVPGWAAALILAGVLLAIGLIAALVAWRGRVRNFLAATQRSLKGNMQWKHQI